MDIEKYLKTKLKGIPLYRLKIKAEIELQNLVDDRIIYMGDCHYTRDNQGDRNGIKVVWIYEAESALHGATILCQRAPEPSAS